jgi:hypothetical protein
MADDWVGSARNRLRTLRRGRHGWGYRDDTAPAVEPTALAGLALSATAGDTPSAPDLAEARSAGDWLAEIQRPDGSLGVSADLPDPGWPTPYATLLWAAIGGYATQRRRAVSWLLGGKGDTDAVGSHGVFGHDATLAGWPWVAGTHSWLEPTAMAILTLRREGLAGHPRTTEGLRLIRDRAIPSGGWNYGNSVVFGRALRAQPGPTGLALLALAGRGRPSAVEERAIGFLLGALPTMRAAPSLGWGVLGLKAWRRCPDAAAGWLAESADRALRRADAAPRLAHLLLAEGRGAQSAFFDPLNGDFSWKDRGDS